MKNKKILLFVASFLASHIVYPQGLHGYIGSNSYSPPSSYNAGVGFYSAIWTLTPNPIAGFQIGLPSTWITPNNSDNTTGALCPIGTYARNNWPQHGPTWDNYFQTIEGGPGYWVGNRFHYGPPKFSMNSTPNCYTNQVASPGWPFFGSSEPLPDSLLGIAQLSNKIIIPPDGLTFSGEPNGELLGLSYMALPLTNYRSGNTPIGENNWTLFLNSTNFKGPIAYFLPETWSKISNNYPFDNGRGLDNRMMNFGVGGSMEINTVPHFTENINGTIYSKIPLLQFPVDGQGRTILTRDITYYSKQAIFDDVLLWRQSGPAPSGSFNSSGSHISNLYTWPVNYTQDGLSIVGINSKATPSVFGGTAFGLQWVNISNTMGEFPQYFEESGNNRYAIDSINLPTQLSLPQIQFNTPNLNPNDYSAPITGIWATPGPTAGPFNTVLADGSLVTYYWYRFINQPVFQQFNWLQAEKDSLQAIVEKIHMSWNINQSYMPAPSGGSLVTFDHALLVTPPAGLEIGYVPIVTRQSLAPTAPIAQLIENQNLDCYSGFEFTFTNISTNNDTSIIWSFPGGNPSTSSDNVVNVQYPTSGPHTVMLIAMNNYGSDTIYSNVQSHQGANPIEIHLTTDMFPYETSLHLELLGDEFFRLDSFTQQYNSYNFPLCLNDGCYTFYIKDSYGDGICCALGDGHYELIDMNGDTLFSGGNFNYIEGYQFCVGNTTIINDLTENTELQIFPNPSSGNFNIKSTGLLKPETYILSDILGRTLRTIEINGATKFIDLQKYASGVYLLSPAKNKTKIYKLVKK